MSAGQGLVTLTVTYHPDAGVLRRQLDAMPAGATNVLVDNGTPDASWASVEEVLAGRPGVEVLRLGWNAGLAAAVNAGLEHAQALGRWRHVLLLDQDSEPLPGSVDKLCAAHELLSSLHSCPVAVGPALRDPVTGLAHAFHRLEGLRYRRVQASGTTPIDCDGLNGSGTLAAFDDFAATGGLDEPMFIDHLDTEWSFRARAAGWRFFGIPDATFVHRMGDDSRRIWLLGWRVWPLRSPWRHRLLFRNGLWLLGRRYVPLAWKAWAVPKLVLTAILFGVLGPGRWKQLRAMGAGCVDGWRWLRGGRPVKSNDPGARPGRAGQGEGDGIG
jgi:rhamnosyltransferase